MARYILFLILILTLVGCASLLMGDDAEKGVRFIIPINAEWFNEDATITVILLNAEQLERSDENSKCLSTFKVKTRTEVRHCPEGVEYQEVTPEKFHFPVNEIGKTIEVRSKSVKVGERYQLSVGGKSDKCGNTTGTTVKDTAHSETITLENLRWGTTLRAC